MEDEVSSLEPLETSVTLNGGLVGSLTAHASLGPLPNPPDEPPHDPEAEVADIGRWLRWSLLASEVLDRLGLQCWRKRLALTH